MKLRPWQYLISAWAINTALSTEFNAFSPELFYTRTADDSEMYDSNQLQYHFNMENPYNSLVPQKNFFS